MQKLKQLVPTEHHTTAPVSEKPVPEIPAPDLQGSWLNSKNKLSIDSMSRYEPPNFVPSIYLALVHPVKAAVAKPNGCNDALAAHPLAKQMPHLAFGNGLSDVFILDVLFQAPKHSKKLKQGRFDPG